VPPKRLRSVIKEKRIALGLTQEQLADKAGVTKNYVTMVERGARKGVSVMVKVALATALDIAPTQLLTDDEAKIVSLLEGGISLEGAEVFVWALERCVADRRAGRASAPPGTKNGAAIALQTILRAHPERKQEIAALRSQVNTLYG
jgi:transcriptional regulator with XRE-family HTH domain